MPRALRYALIAAGATAVAAVAGCTSRSSRDADLVAGKRLFVQKCGSCHVLARAGTKGTVGPDLDAAFRQSLRNGFGRSGVRGVVLQQIDIARPGGAMPADLVKGKAAFDVASYVAAVAARPGKDTGLLASAVASQQSKKPAVAVGGKLTIPADPSGQLAFVNATAQAKAGQVTLDMPNKSGVPHNIAIDGKGAGKIVANGTSSFSASFAPGTYTYYCQVPGHREAGMVGKLVVK